MRYWKKNIRFYSNLSYIYVYFDKENQGSSRDMIKLSRFYECC